MRSTALSFVILMSVLGCGDDNATVVDGPGVGGASGGAAGSGSTGTAARTTALKDLSQSELISLCRANEAKLESLGGCEATGIEESTEAECQAAVAQCEKASATESYNDIDCAGASTSGLSNCAVTVGEFSDCLTDLQNYLKSLTCKDAGKPITPPRCFTTVSSKCPGLFD